MGGRNVEFAAAAQAEAEHAAAWYAQTAGPARAEALAVAVGAAVARLARRVVALTPVLGDAGTPVAHKLRIVGFPYDLIVLRIKAGFLVIAVAHHRREPGYWRDRVFVDAE